MQIDDIGWFCTLKDIVDALTEMISIKLLKVYDGRGLDRSGDNKMTH